MTIWTLFDRRTVWLARAKYKARSRQYWQPPLFLTEFEYKFGI